MIDYTDIDTRLEEYSNAFDTYMESGEMPSTISDEDHLAAYMQEVIDSNPQVDGSDSTWVDVLKEELISFFSVLLEHFRELQLQAQKELDMIENFTQASIEQKRKMWSEVCRTIKAGYSEYDVNLAGYTAMFKTEDRDAVFSALTSDWEYACRAKLVRNETQIFGLNKSHFEKYCRETGQKDYENRHKVAKYLHRFPQLKEIVDIIGRDKESSKEEDTVVNRFMPSAVSKNSTVTDVDRIETGDNIERVLPVEYSMPEDIFYKRYATKELLQFSSPGKEKKKRSSQHKNTPRQTKGPIIVSIDTSYSMTGQPLQIAFSLLKQLLDIAKKQKRPCYLISFSVRTKSLDLAKPSNWSRVDSILDNSFTGGTDGEEMLSESIRVLQNDIYEMADVLIISDFEFKAPDSATIKNIENEKKLGTRFYGLCIGQYATIDYEAKILDRMWTI